MYIVKNIYIYGHSIKIPWLIDLYVKFYGYSFTVDLDEGLDITVRCGDINCYTIDTYQAVYVKFIVWSGFQRKTNDTEPVDLRKLTAT